MRQSALGALEWVWRTNRRAENFGPPEIRVRGPLGRGPDQVSDGGSKFSGRKYFWQNAPNRILPVLRTPGGRQMAQETRLRGKNTLARPPWRALRQNGPKLGGRTNFRGPAKISPAPYLRPPRPRDQPPPALQRAGRRLRCCLWASRVPLSAPKRFGGA